MEQTFTVIGVAVACFMNAAVTAGRQAPSGSVPAPGGIIGLDHIPIAVANLEQAADRYKALGFALKPGRPHDNGIRNQHIKFPDGTELELITAPEARDALTTKYRRHLAAGDGPAFLRSTRREGRACRTKLCPTTSFSVRATARQRTAPNTSRIRTARNP